MDAGTRPADPHPTRVFLIGLMGSGKTTVGRHLSQRLGCPMVDNDVALHAGTGRSTAELAGQGPALLHRLEGLQLDLATAAPGPLVVTVAASVAEDDERRRRLRDIGAVVYLRVDSQELARRVRDSQRPWVSEDAIRVLEHMRSTRDSLLVAMATQVVDATDLGPEQVADRIYDRLR